VTIPQTYYPDSGVSSQLVGSLASLLQTAASPDAVEARNMILRRLALQGDIVGSRIPPPRNISEVGGYINLLTSLSQPEMRAQMLAGILGVAGPSQPLGWDDDDPPFAFVNLPNDRPTGPGQASIPITFVVRSDFSGALQAVLDELRQRGCAIPFFSPPVWTLPPAAPGTLPPDDVLPFLGRTLNLATSAALVSPSTDALVVARSQGAADSFQIAAQVLAPAVIPVNMGNYEALQCNAVSCSTVPIQNTQLVSVATFLGSAGFYPASPLPIPSSSGSTAWARLTNITGLVPSVTKLGDELALLYKRRTINRSVFASVLNRVWNGTAFV
jgi:hypothetical protein